MAQRLDISFALCENTLTRAFSNQTVTFGTWGSFVTTKGYLKDFNICNIGKGSGEGNDDDANLTLSFTYTLAPIDNTGVVNEYTKFCEMDLYSTIGDNAWSNRMKLRVFDGDYPSTVAVDKNTATVYFVKVGPIDITFEKFGVLDDDDLDALENINVRAPYRICIDPNAMFLVLDGSEGDNYLRKNLMVEFDCGRPIIVRPSEECIANIDVPFI